PQRRVDAPRRHGAPHRAGHEPHRAAARSDRRHRAPRRRHAARSAVVGDAGAFPEPAVRPAGDAAALARRQAPSRALKPARPTLPRSTPTEWKMALPHPRIVLAPIVAAGCIALCAPAAAQNWIGLMKNTPAERFNEEDIQLFLNAAKKTLNDTPE